MLETPAENKTFIIGGDLEVNRMGFGAMRITGPGVWGPPADKNAALEVLKRAVELGVDFIDTADSYGPHVSEELIAEALYPYSSDLVIATKGGLTRTGPNEWHLKADPDYLRKALEGSLKRLRVERIDLYQLHRIDPETPFEKTLEFLKKAQEEGKIKHIGLSEVSVSDIQKAREFVPIVSVQNKYSVDYRKWEPELNFCRDNAIAFIPWYPINAGNLEGMNVIEVIAKKYEVSAYQVALNWLYRHASNILLIPGTSNIHHLEENSKSAELALDKEDMQKLNEIVKENV